METVRLGGLRNVLKRSKLNESEKVKSADKPHINESVEGLNPLDLSTAVILLKEYSQLLVNANRKSLASFFADPIAELKNNHLMLTVGSKMAAQDIEEEHNKLRQFAASKGYIMLKIKCSINAAKVSDYKVFTPKQQFDVLVKKYPMLKEFENRFNLDFNA